MNGLIGLDEYMKDVIAIGGGISGLSAAFFLKKKGRDVLLLEKADHLGGVMGSLEKDGYLLEYGPNTFMGLTPALREMIQEVGLTQDLISPPLSSKKRYIYKSQKLHLLPLNPLHFFLKFSLLSLCGKLRLLKEPFISKGSFEKTPEETPEETIEEFFSRRFGKEMTQNLVDPFVSGIYAGDISKLSIEACFPEIFSLEQTYGSIIKGFLKRPKTTPKKDHTLYSFKKGLGQLPKALEEWFGKSVWKNSQVTHLQKKEEGGFKLEVVSKEGTKTLETRSLVLATPAYESAQLLQKIDSQLATELLHIPYNSLSVFHVGFLKKDIRCSLGAVEGFGFLIPRVEHKKTLGVLWSSSLFYNRAPKDHVLLTVMAKGDTSAKDMLSEIKPMLGIESDPVFFHEKNYLRAIPQYELGHLKREHRIRELIKNHPGLSVTGNFMGGVSTVQCVEQAQKCVNDLLLDTV